MTETTKVVKEILEKAKSGTTILPCNCKHAFQDERYGSGMRLHNVMANKQNGDARCTVCGSVKR